MNEAAAFAKGKFLLDSGISFVVDKARFHLNSSTDDFSDNSILIKNKNFEISTFFEELNGGNSCRFRFRIRNTGRKPLVINEINILDTSSSESPLLDLGSDPASFTYFNFSDHLNENSVARFSDNDGMHQSKVFCHIYNPAEKTTFFAATLTFGKMLSEFKLKYDEKKKSYALLWKQLVNDFELPPEGELATEELYLEKCSRSPFAVLESWADMVNAIYKPRIPDSPHVGITTSWAWVDTIEGELPEEYICENLEAAKSRLGNFAIKYYYISISNLKNRLPGNWLCHNENNFPSGIEKTLAKVRECGFQPGFWFAPFYVTENAESFEINKDNVFKDSPVLWPWTFSEVEIDGRLPRIYCLDPSHPHTIDFICKSLKHFLAMGVKYFMVDFLQAGRPLKENVPYDRTFVKGWEAFRKAMLEIRKTAGEEVCLLSAIGSTLGNIGGIDSCRIGSDYGEGRTLLKQFPSYPAGYVINGNLGEVGCPNKNAIRNLACWYFAHNKFFMCDSNKLTVDKPIPRNEAEISVSLFGISGGPLFLGDDFRRISEERLQMLKKCLPRMSSSPVPVDLFTNLDNDVHRRIFIVQVDKEFAKWTIAALFNLEDEAAEFALDADELRLEKDQAYQMFDFWNESYCGEFVNNKQVIVPANSAAVFRFERTKPHPWLLSTDMHVRQGEAELTDLQWDAEKLILRGIACRPRGEKGNLYIVAPPEYKERNFNRNLWVAKSAINENLIIRKELCFESDSQDWKIEFALLDDEENEWLSRHRKRFYK
jgi:hypothetical protein